MSSIRKTKTSSGASAVQVVRYENRKVVIMKHLGSAKDTTEIAALIQDAEAWINRETPDFCQVKKPKKILSKQS